MINLRRLFYSVTLLAIVGFALSGWSSATHTSSMEMAPLETSSVAEILQPEHDRFQELLELNADIIETQKLLDDSAIKESLDVNIKPSKASYMLGESITLTVTLKNNGTHHINLAGTKKNPNLSIESAYTYVNIKTDDDEFTYRKIDPMAIYSCRSTLSSMITYSPTDNTPLYIRFPNGYRLASKETRSADIDLEVDSEGQLITGDDGIPNFLEPGNYELTVEYHGAGTATPIMSNTIKITVLEN